MAGRFGSILIGLGLILFALQWIRTAAQRSSARGVKVMSVAHRGP